MTKAKAIEILNQEFDDKYRRILCNNSDDADYLNDLLIALLTAIDVLEQDNDWISVKDRMPEPVKQDGQLFVILQDFGIDNAEQLCYILEQYQKVIEEITGGQMSYLTYPAQAVLECANDRYLSALADLKEDE